VLAIQQPRIKPSYKTTASFSIYASRYWETHLGDGGITSENLAIMNSKILSLFCHPMNPGYLNRIRSWDPEARKTDWEMKKDDFPLLLFMTLFLLKKKSRRLSLTTGHIGCQQEGRSNVHYSTAIFSTRFRVIKEADRWW
jgi:hypothetical protein